MKRKLKLNKYFLDPRNDSCDELIRQVRVLDDSIKKLGKANQARIPGVVSEKYEEYLKKSSIPKTNQDPKKVMRDISGLFQGSVRWHHPGTMINITPPPLILTQEVGKPHLDRALGGVIALLRSSATWGGFERAYARAYGEQKDQLMLPMAELDE